MATKEKYTGRGKFSAKAKKSRQADMLRKAAKHTQERQEQEARKARAPQVHYDQPAPFNKRRFAMQIGIVAAVVAAILLGVSVFFNVENVVVYGNDKYDAWTIREASGIAEGENLLAFGSVRAEARIVEELPYIESVRIGVTLPDTVNIYVTEYPVVYSVEATDGSWWVMASDGRVVDQTDVGGAAENTQILGMQLSNPVAGQQAVPAESAPETTTNAAGEVVQIPVITSGADRLSAAMAVMKSLELNNVLGQAATIDVSRPGNMVLWYGQRFEVLLGDSKDMDKKIYWMQGAIDQMEDYQTGTLDVTFTTYPNQAGFTPFE